MAVIEFRTLGTLDLRRADGSELHSLLAQPKRVALLAYLCVATPRGFHRRDTLLGLFWPNVDQTHARTSLRNALHVLRHSLGETAFHSRGDEEVAVNFDAIWCDAVAFEEQTGSEEAERALDLYRGDFLAGFFLDEVPAFERWLDSERASLRASAARVARVAAERLELEQNFTGAIALARRAVDLTDIDERAVRRLVDLLARVGDRAGALDAYESFARQLAVEFGAEPSVETRALVDRLRRQQAAARPSDQTVTPADEAESARPSVTGYSIHHELGRGATSTVYLARDLKHDRPVAIKFLRPEVAALLGTERFLAEIALAARLHHPHILPLLDSGTANGLPYYVMPYVEGETLRSRLRREKFLPIGDAIRIASEVADALGYAHTHDIVHRDIKPENILLDNDHAMVADFGIAQALSEAGGKRLTETGIAVGTAAYMSPEQADGSVEVDRRSDIYALGCVVYEMLTGDPPFSGSTAQAILARKAAEPALPMRTVRDTVPVPLERNVLKALSRAPADRFATAKEFATALASPIASPTSTTHVAPSTKSRRGAGVALIGVLLLAVGLSVGRKLSGVTHVPPEVRQKLTSTGDAVMASASPDGQFLAYVTQPGDSQNVLLQDLTGGTPVTITTVARPITSIEWSPDGTRILMGGFDRAIILPRLRGSGVRMGPKIGATALSYWLPDGKRISAYNPWDRRIMVFDPNSEDTLALPIKGEYAWLNEGTWSPSGRVFAAMTETVDPVSWQLRTVNLSGQSEVILNDSIPLGSPRWAPDGRELYFARGSDAVWRIPVSRETGASTGPAEQVVADLQMYSQRFGLVHFALTPNGRGIVYARGARFSNLWLLSRKGESTIPNAIALTTGTALRWSPTISPDGASIAFVQEVGGSGEVFIMAMKGRRLTQLTAGARVHRESEIAWSPDGEEIAFSTVRGGHAQVWVAAGDGRMRAFEQTRMSTATGHLTWAPGKEIAYQRANHENINLIDPVSGKERALVQSTPSHFLHSPAYSPDGSHLAAMWFRGPDKVGVYSFDLRRSTFVRLGNGWYPRGWSVDGRYIYLQSPMSSAIRRLDSRGDGNPKPFLQPSFREAQCSPVGATEPDKFVCAVFDFTSDVWRIENFDQQPR